MPFFPSLCWLKHLSINSESEEMRHSVQKMVYFTKHKGWKRKAKLKKKKLPKIILPEILKWILFIIQQIILIKNFFPLRFLNGMNKDHFTKFSVLFQRKMSGWDSSWPLFSSYLSCIRLGFFYYCMHFSMDQFLHLFPPKKYFLWPYTLQPVSSVLFFQNRTQQYSRI